MGRLEKVAPKARRRGHAVRVRAGSRVLGVSKTDSSGRFLVEWPYDGEENGVVVEVMDPRGGVSESAGLSAEEMKSPPVVIFTGDGVVESGLEGAEEFLDGLLAEGDHPLRIDSSCQETRLSWNSPEGARVSIISEGESPRDGLPHSGSLNVRGDQTQRYTRRVWLPGASPEQFSDSTVEVRRYPSLSLVFDEHKFSPGSTTEFGVALSCPAREGGLEAVVLTSDEEIVPSFVVKVAAGSRWADKLVVLGRKRGRAQITACAIGYARDIVPLLIE